ncbi:MAG: hypothetical protein GY805_40070 [Chloroflexi bacterium]|nr:hypothetical protein [Chloroflexota bacterium]
MNDTAVAKQKLLKDMDGDEINDNQFGWASVVETAVSYILSDTVVSDFSAIMIGAEPHS